MGPAALRNVTGTRFGPLLLAAALCCHCSAETLGSTKPKIVIHSPVAGEHDLTYQPITLSVSAHDAAGITSLTLVAGHKTGQTCAGNGAQDLDCSQQFNPDDFAAQIANGALVLTANAVDARGATNSETVIIYVKPIRVAFTAPTPAGSPPVATVKGTSPLTLTVDTESVVQSVQVTDANNVPLGPFTPPGPYTVMVNWQAALRIGMDTLTATATDMEGNTDTAQLAVQVQCATDGDCDVGQKCCASSGACYASAMSTTCQ